MATSTIERSSRRAQSGPSPSPSPSPSRRRRPRRFRRLRHRRRVAVAVAGLFFIIASLFGFASETLEFKQASTLCLGLLLLDSRELFHFLLQLFHLTECCKRLINDDHAELRVSDELLLLVKVTTSTSGRFRPR